MLDAVLLFAAFVSAAVGLAWLALAMDAHWRQVRGARQLARTTALALRVLGAFALGLSLGLALRTDHASIAALVWVMLVTAGVLAVAFTLAWRPRLLAPLVFWVRAA